MLPAAAPLLPTPSITDAEMACCRKMAGNCDMGSGNHSCCKTTMNDSQLAIAIAQNPHVQLQDSLIAVPILLTAVKIDFAREYVRATASPIPISPPGSQPILKI
jgi:hypothetical protein